MQLHLRFLLQQSFSEFNDAPKLEKLINKGKVLGGSVLDMDVVLAEKHLVKLVAFLRDVGIVQSVCRGYICREKLLRERNFREAHMDYLRKVKWQSKALARLFVADVVTFCVHANSKEMMKPTLRIAAHMSDIFVVASVHLKARGARKHVRLLCPLCNHTNKKPPRAIVTAADFEIIATSPPLVCTCRMVTAEEQWVVRAYDPLSGATHTKDLNIAEVQQIVIDIKAAHALLDPLYRLMELFSLNGTLRCDPLGPLFDSSKADLYCSNGDLGPSPSLAMINSGKESSVLFSLPRVLSDMLLLSAAKSGEGNYLSRDMDLLKALRYRGSRSPLVVSNVFDLNTTATPKSTWEPLTDYYQSIRLNTWAINFMQALETLYDNSVFFFENCKTLVLKLQKRVQWANMTMEDCLANLYRTELLLAEATAKVQRAMLLSHNNLEEVTMQEKGLKENRKTAWSSLEDGNEWIGLNHRRKYIRVLNIHEKAYQISLINYDTDVKKLRDAMALALRIKQDVDNNKLWMEIFRPNVSLLDTVSRRMRDLTGELVTAVIKTFSLPYKMMMGVGSSSSNAVTGRRLQRVPFNAVFARDPYVRTRHAYRSAWKSFGSTPLAVGVSNVLPHQNIPNLARCVAEVFYDPLTTNYLLRVSENCPLEEALQHQDIRLPYVDFTNITPTYPNELLLSKGDMDALFTKTPEWPRYLQFEKSMHRTKASRRTLETDTAFDVPETVLDDEEFDVPETVSDDALDVSETMSLSDDQQGPVAYSTGSRKHSQKLSLDKKTTGLSASHVHQLGSSRSRIQNKETLSPFPSPSPSHSSSPQPRPRLEDKGGISRAPPTLLPQDITLPPYESRERRVKASSSFSVTSKSQLSIKQSLARSATAPTPFPTPSPSPGRYFIFCIILCILCIMY